jgi:hypothetical protein
MTRAFYYVLYKDVEKFLKCGWIAYPPNSTDHHHAYGIEVMWICDCEPVVPDAGTHLSAPLRSR